MEFVLKISGCKYLNSKRFFVKANRQVERSSEIIFTLLMKIALQCYMLPKCVVSFGAYFFIDLGGESFQLPLPMW